MAPNTTLFIALIFVALFSTSANGNTDLIEGDPMCYPAYRIANTDLCTHGEDWFPVIAAGTIPPALTPGGIICDGDGVGGKRVQLMYAHDGASVEQYQAAIQTIRNIAAQVDATIDASAHETGGHRHVRFVTGADCEPVVLSLALAVDTFSGMVQTPKNYGHTSPDRKYLIFGESNFACGKASVPSADFDDTTAYAYVGRDCWRADVATHELIHMLGGIQHDAPNASGGWHCTDGHDLMCYSDPPDFPTLRLVCGPAFAWLLDCGNDDYFHTDPPAGSYLADGWNVANSAYLIADVGPVSWFVWAPIVRGAAE